MLAESFLAVVLRTKIVGCNFVRAGRPAAGSGVRKASIGAHMVHCLLPAQVRSCKVAPGSWLNIFKDAEDLAVSSYIKWTLSSAPAFAGTSHWMPPYCPLM